MTVTLNRWCEHHQTRCAVAVREDGQELHNRVRALDWAAARPNRVVWDAGCADDYGNVALRYGTILRHADIRLDPSSPFGFRVASDAS